VSIREVKDDITNDLLRRDLKPRVQIHKNYFTPRELKIMGRVAEFFKELKANDMSEFSHMKRLPWRKVYEEGKGSGKLIPPDLSLDSDALVHDAPTIEREELEDRREALRDIA
jgi:hypothetical protein